MCWCRNRDFGAYEAVEKAFIEEGVKFEYHMRRESVTWTPVNEVVNAHT